MGRWRAWLVMGVMWGVGCSSPPTDSADEDTGTDGLEAICEAAGGDFYAREPAMICVFGERQGTPVGPGFVCPEGFPNRLGDSGLLFCNATDVFPTQVLIDLDARYPECGECIGDVGPDAELDVDPEDAGEPVEALCATPDELVLVEGEADVEGRFADAAADAGLACDANARLAHVYVLTTTEPGDLVVEVEVDGEEGIFVPALSVRSVCDQRASLLPGACVAHRARPGKNAVVVVSAEAATYYVWVATSAADAGAYRLRASLRARQGAQPEGSCQGLPRVALADGESLGLAVSAGGQFEQSGTLCEHEASSRTEVDVEVQADGFLTVDLLRGEGQGFAARLREACGQAQDEQCGDIIVGERRRNLLRAEVEAGVKTLSLGNLPNSALPGYEVVFRHSSEPAGQSCARPQALNLSSRDEAGVFEATIPATLLGYEDRRGPACGINGRDRVWAMELDEPSDVWIEARSASGAPLSVSWTEGCEQQGICSVTEVRRSGVAAGTYFVWVDGDLDDPASFDLVVRVAPTLAGGSCEAPDVTRVLAAGEPLRVQLRQEDGPAGLVSCAGDQARDRVIALQLAEPGDLAIAYAGEVPLEGLVVEHALSCEESGACGALDGGIAALSAGEQVLKIASTREAVEGDLEVELELLPPGERCFGAQALALNQDHEVSLQDYQADEAPGCVSEGPAADRVFAFELDTPRTVLATLTPRDPGHHAALWVERGACGAAQTLACNAGEAGQAVTLVLGALQPGMYRIWVGGDPGEFTLNITTN